MGLYFPNKMDRTSPRHPQIFSERERGAVVELRYRVQQPWFESWFCHLLAVWPWVSYLISLGLQLFLILVSITYGHGEDGIT